MSDSKQDIKVGDVVTIGSWGYRWTVTGFKLSPFSGGRKAVLTREQERGYRHGNVGKAKSAAVIRTRVAVDTLVKEESK
ncbi:hypothetical protein SEA_BRUTONGASTER_70 [Gordonia phage BrutonGaster]|uniref:Uncharacterized protein n=1 Tax=Gordonia phage BrutonGaster TaxID=2530116 RepID=A0A482JLN0_9CAUD|nr:hypothetical protein HOV26_gp112 [Gordonia phage BrutonGaster]QBP33287.1 hypothetical protein SEA_BRUTONGASTER_70 [Gordonia phage BrutonGaster]